MNKACNLLLSAIFSVSASVLMPQQAGAQTFSKNEKISTRLDGLKGEDGSAFDPRSLAGKHLLIFFGTPYQTPSCASVFGEQALALKLVGGQCAAYKGEIVPVFIYPEAHDASKNKESVRKAKSSDFLVLHGDYKTVSDLISRYYGMYVQRDEHGDPAAHTTFVYLQNDEGKNILLYPAKAYAALSYPQILKALKADGFGCDSAPAPR